MAHGEKGFIAALIGGLLLLSTVSLAADQGITGKKLQLKDPSKVKVLSKDSTISIMGSDPVGGADSSITFDDGTNSTTWALPATGWSANGAGTKFKYKNDAAPAGASPISGIKIGAGKLKVSGTSVPFAVPNGAATVDVTLNLDGGTNTYCMSFSGMGDGSKFAVKEAGAGSCGGGGGQMCGNNVREGTEACDGSDAASCPATCQSDCTCPGGTVCGNNVKEGAEACDGSDSTACPGACTATCTCASCGDSAYPTCGGTCPLGETCESTNTSNVATIISAPDCFCINPGNPCSFAIGASCPALGECPSDQICELSVVTFAQCGRRCCSPSGSACTSDLQCCTSTCLPGGTCSPCVANGGSCDGGVDCCSGVCTPGGVCAACLPAGDPCGSNQACCSGNCDTIFSFQCQ